MQNKCAKLLVMAVVAVSAVTVNAQTVKGTIALPASPIGVAVDPFLNRVYAAVPTFNGSYDYLSVIDGNKDVDIKNVTIPPIAYAVAVDLVRSLVYVGGQNFSTGASEVTVVSALTNKVVTTFQVTGTSSGVGSLLWL